MNHVAVSIGVLLVMLACPDAVRGDLIRHPV